MLSEFLAAPRRVGAVAASSRHLARRLADLAFARHPRTVVEIGAGSGAVTRELAARARQQGARFVAVELDARLARKAGSAHTVQAHAAWLPVRRADVIVSGIPFASLHSEDAEDILREAARIAPRLVLFQYSRRRLRLITKHFPDVLAAHKVRWNIPPAFAIEASHG